jgi:hypothetical protein
MYGTYVVGPAVNLGEEKRKKLLGAKKEGNFVIM